MGIAHKKNQKKKMQPQFDHEMEVVVFFFSLHLISTSKTKMSKYET